MNATLTAGLVAASFFAAVLAGRRLRRVIPEDHRGEQTRHTVKLGMGLVATMTALLLGLLVTSAKGSYDATRGQVIQLAARIAYLDRVLLEYGPDAADVRSRLRVVTERALRHIWPEEKDARSQLTPERNAGDELYSAILRLSPRDDMQRTLKAEAINVTSEIGKSRELLLAQAVPSISTPLLVVVIVWLVLIFVSSSLIAPDNATADLSLMISALSVSGAIFLMLELDRPFGGSMRISSEPILRTLSQIASQSP